ncbi:MAG TPA: ABC transporter ATP-binding protein [Bacillota bacterium]
MMLSVRGVSAAYGSVPVLHDVSLDVAQGEMVTILGANGAGKTTLFRVISGVLRPTAGQVVFAGGDITRLPPHRITQRGIGQVPEGRQIFNSLTVLDNLLLAACYGNPSPRWKAEAEESLAEVFDLFPVLRERQRQRAGTLSGGQQQMVAIARALMTRPKLLLLDEPSLGLAPMLVRSIFEVLRELNRRGMTVLLIEQNAHVALRVSDTAYVIEHGRVGLTGPSRELLHMEAVRYLYLGRRAHSRSLAGPAPGA